VKEHPPPITRFSAGNPAHRSTLRLNVNGQPIL
jgi:hypothetical protein